MEAQSDLVSRVVPPSRSLVSRLSFLISLPSIPSRIWGLTQQWEVSNKEKKLSSKPASIIPASPSLCLGHTTTSSSCRFECIYFIFCGHCNTGDCVVPHVWYLKYQDAVGRLFARGTTGMYRVYYILYEPWTRRKKAIYIFGRLAMTRDQFYTPLRIHT